MLRLTLGIFVAEDANKIRGNEMKFPGISSLEISANRHELAAHSESLSDVGIQGFPGTEISDMTKSIPNSHSSRWRLQGFV